MGIFVQITSICVENDVIFIDFYSVHFEIAVMITSIGIISFFYEGMKFLKKKNLKMDVLNSFTDKNLKNEAVEKSNGFILEFIYNLKRKTPILCIFVLIATTSNFVYFRKKKSLLTEI